MDSSCPGAIPLVQRARSLPTIGRLYLGPNSLRVGPRTRVRDWGEKPHDVIARNWSKSEAPKRSSEAW